MYFVNSLRVPNPAGSGFELVIGLQTTYIQTTRKAYQENDVTTHICYARDDAITAVAFPAVSGSQIEVER